MTRKELSDYLKLNENYLRTHWPRICESCSKRGIDLYKEGRGEAAAYGIKPEWDCKIYWDYEKLLEGR